MQARIIGTLLLQAIAGETGKEAGYGSLIAAAGTAISVCFGGWDIAIKLLLTLMLLDYVSGIMSALKKKSINSDVMFWGGVRKGVVLAVILLAIQFDQLSGNEAPIFRTLALYYYIGREGLSVVENFGSLGVKIPQELEKRLTQLQVKDEADDKRL
ncbi:phage holin family protein [Paenibacillus cymbidii]|uniref:phage holin family protein n=1 Tax=Paenibacillus cymbidii TaxID=1639034 RepID=UPI00108135E6|nr:phage holin family protein [Paenibacillus cymbidii]